jgi:hypothetical protein
MAQSAWRVLTDAFFRSVHVITGQNLEENGDAHLELSVLSRYRSRQSKVR